MHPSEEVIYNGRAISKEHFRAFVYGVEGQQKLVKSWDEFQTHMSTGIWFSSKEELEDKTAKPQKKKVLRKEPDEVLPNQAGE